MRCYPKAHKPRITPPCQQQMFHLKRSTERRHCSMVWCRFLRQPPSFGIDYLASFRRPMPIWSSIEFYRGRQKLAPFCSRYSKGIAVAREKSAAFVVQRLHFVKPNRMLHADDLLRRNIGGSRNGGNATNRDAELLLIDQQELDASISRTENWMCIASAVFRQGSMQGWRYRRTHCRNRLWADLENGHHQALERSHCRSPDRSQSCSAFGFGSLWIRRQLHRDGPIGWRCLRVECQGAGKLQQASHSARNAHRRVRAIRRRAAWERGEE